jgi:hypothetical protein
MTHLHVTRLSKARSVAFGLIALSACSGSDAATSDAGEARSFSETTSASRERDGGTRRPSQRDERSDAVTRAVQQLTAAQASMLSAGWMRGALDMLVSTLLRTVAWMAPVATQ